MLETESQHLTWVGPIGMLLAVFSFLKKNEKPLNKNKCRLNHFLVGNSKITLPLIHFLRNTI